MGVDVELSEAALEVLATVRWLMFRVVAMSRVDWPCASWWMICASRSVSPALISALVMSVPSRVRVSLVCSSCWAIAFAEGLDEQRASAVEQLALSVGVVVVGAAERDREQPVRAGGERECDLVLDPERGVHVLAEGERPQLAAGDQVREAVGAPVAGPGEVSGDRVLVAVADERLQRLGGQRGFGDADHGCVVRFGAEVVQRRVVGWHRASQRLQQTDSELVQVGQADDVLRERQ